jgi:hypothetical protein
LPISYQWFWNGNSSVTQRFLNASISVTDHTCTLVLSNVPSNQAGSYNVSVSNVAGLVESISALLTVLADTDGDRIPDEWEIAYGLRPDDPTDATADSDQDGLTNLDEYRAGTNPTDALSLLKIDMVQLVGPGLDRLVLRFSTVANKTYSIQHATSLGVGSWTNLVNLEAEASDRVVAITNPIPTGSSLGHFRLVIPRQP